VFGREILDEWGYGTGERVVAVEDGPIRKRPGWTLKDRLPGRQKNPRDRGKNLPGRGKMKNDQKLKISLPNSRIPSKPI